MKITTIAQKYLEPVEWVELIRQGCCTLLQRRQTLVSFAAASSLTRIRFWVGRLFLEHSMASSVPEDISRSIIVVLKLADDFCQLGIMCCT